MKTIRLASCILLATIGLIIGCATQKTIPNPLAGWHFSSLDNLHANQVIMDDYQDYIQKLPAQKNRFISSIHFFEDGTGQHAVEIRIGVNGAWWEHVLIYDSANKRIKVTRYSRGRYRS
jgi:hypothetical protein